MLKYNPNWLDILRVQDERLRFEHFSNADALKIGLHAIEAAKEFGKGFSIRVIANGAIVFSHHMDGTSKYNDWWMDKKLNTCREVQLSSLRFFTEVEGGLRPRPNWLEYEGNYCIDGGCVPMRMKDGRVFGYVITSGASHELDHEVATRGIARFLGIEIPSVS